jgi:hypothetical protein
MLLSNVDYIHELLKYQKWCNESEYSENFW